MESKKRRFTGGFKREAVALAEPFDRLTAGHAAMDTDDPEDFVEVQDETTEEYRKRREKARNDFLHSICAFLKRWKEITGKDFGS